jgi:transglutaminase-like putative cysteine protease
MGQFDKYLIPSYLCDFNNVPNIGTVADSLIDHATDKSAKFERIFHFVKEFKYGLEDWDVKASDTLQKKWGMCSGKTNLLVAMLRYLGIPAKYIVYRIQGEGLLWRWIAKQNNELADLMGKPSREQDHIVAEVYLKNWMVVDTSRDTLLEKGLKKLDIPLERRRVSSITVTELASFDEWAINRQQIRRFREDRELVFRRINEQFEAIRDLANTQGINGEYRINN